LESARKYGPVCAFGVRPMRMVTVGDPELIQRLLTMKAENFRWGHFVQRIGPAFVVGRSSMLASDGVDHRRRRGSVQKGFSRPRLNRWISTIVERTDAQLDAITTGLAVGTTRRDLYLDAREIIIGTTVNALFGEQTATRANEIGELFRRPQAFIEQSAVRQLPHPMPWGKRAQVRRDRRALHAIVDTEIARRRRHLSHDPYDVLEAIVTDATLTDDEIRDQVLTLIGAGYDTTAATFAWLLWSTVLTPGVWERLRIEADRVLHDAAEDLGPDALARLEFAGRCVRESLRLHPAGVVGVRQAVTDIELGDCTIPAGAMIAWSPYLAGRDSSVWRDPLQFEPDRHLDQSAEQAALTEQAWVPFGRGPHMCIGFALAQMELTLMISRFAQRLDLAATASTTPRPAGLIVNRPTGGAPFDVTARSRPTDNG
jgi:cytochrome P450